MAAINKVATVIQLRRGTSTEVGAFTPALGEVVLDTTFFREVAGDGFTVGGFPVGRAQLTTLNNSSVYTVLGTDVSVIFTALSTAVTHTVTLPLASNYPIGQELRIQDGAGLAASTNSIVIKASTTNNGVGFDTINASSATISISTAGGGRSLVTNGTTGWIAFST